MSRLAERDIFLLSADRQKECSHLQTNLKAERNRQAQPIKPPPGTIPDLSIYHN